MKRSRRLRNAGWNAVGIALFVVLVFPVYWMITTALKPDADIIAAKPSWIPLHPTTAHFGNAMHQPYFWQDVKNSVIIVLVTVVISMVLALADSQGEPLTATLSGATVAVAVPEPSAVVILIVGMLGMMGWAARRRIG